MTGVDKFMNSGLPLIELALFDSNDDPHVLNSVFGSKNSKRILQFQSISNYITSIDPNIDPRNFRRVYIFAIISKTMRDTDFIALEKFEFRELILLELVLNKILDCQTLRTIRKMGKKAMGLIFYFEDTYGLNSTCLSAMPEQENAEILPSQLTIAGDWPYTELRHFVGSFLNKGQELEKLIIPKTYVSAEKIEEVATYSDISSVTKLFFDWNNLTDAAVQALLADDLPEATHISLVGNPITADALKKMVGKTYYELLFLDLSRNYIGDEGIRTLITNSFPVLQVLRLVDVDLTVEGLL